MSRWRRVGGCVLLCVLPLNVVAGHAGVQEPPALRVLVFSKTSAFRHDSIEAGVEAVERLGTSNGFTVDATEDATWFTPERLSTYGAVVFLSTTGDVLAPDQEAAFESYIRNGGGYVGIHSAADTEYDWAWYGGLVGAYFLSHPEPQTATLSVEDHVHESTAHLGATWQRFDEWYDFRDDPRARVHVLLSIEPASLSGSQMTSDHPIAWCHDYDGGRAWYTGLGHTKESWAEPDFLRHVLGGIRTAAGVATAGCATPAELEATTTAPSAPATSSTTAGSRSTSSSLVAPPVGTTSIAARRVSAGRWTAASIVAGCVVLAGVSALFLVRRRSH